MACEPSIGTWTWRKGENCAILTEVKVCGLTRTQDLEWCLELGVTRVGFVLAPSPRQLTLPQLDLLLQVLPPAFPWVAVLVDPALELIQQLLDRQCPILQMHGQESAEFCSRWRPQARVVKALRLASPADLHRCGLYDVDEFLLDSPRPGHGQAFDWQWIDQGRPRRDFYLAGGLDSTNVEQAILQVGPRGVDVSSGVEERPGIKDLRKLKAFVERARNPLR